MQIASEGPRSGMGWGPIPAADTTLKMQFAGERERVRLSSVPRCAAATGGRARAFDTPGAAATPSG
jgi:hypothetical protein